MHITIIIWNYIARVTNETTLHCKGQKNKRRLHLQEEFTRQIPSGNFTYFTLLLERFLNWKSHLWCPSCSLLYWKLTSTIHIHRWRTWEKRHKRNNRVGSQSCTKLLAIDNMTPTATVDSLLVQDLTHSNTIWVIHNYQEKCHRLQLDIQEYQYGEYCFKVG